MKKKILFVTGTRADYGKIKSLILKLQFGSLFKVHVFARFRVASVTVYSDPVSPYPTPNRPPE